MNKLPRSGRVLKQPGHWSVGGVIKRTSEKDIGQFIIKGIGYNKFIRLSCSVCL